jgi:hypothetical protein
MYLAEQASRAEDLSIGALLSTTTYDSNIASVPNVQPLKQTSIQLVVVTQISYDLPQALQERGEAAADTVEV